MPRGHTRTQSEAAKFSVGISSPLFPEVDALLSLFKNSGTQLIDLRKKVSFIIVLGYRFLLLVRLSNIHVCPKIDGKLNNLKKEVASQDYKHRNTLSEVSCSSSSSFIACITHVFFVEWCLLNIFA